MTGLSGNQTEGVPAVVGSITDKTVHKASYAVQIGFTDLQGQGAETCRTGAGNLGPGRKEQPVVFGHEPPSRNRHRV